MNLLKNPEYWSNEYWWPPTLPNPKIIDFYDDRECYIWYLFTEEGHDFNLEECADEEQGERPEWLEEEQSYSGADLYDFAGSIEIGASFGLEGIGRTATWALENGIAPYQPFRIHLMPPRWYNTSYEYPDEVDVEWTWWVDRIMRISDFDASRRWEHWMAERKLHFEWMEDHRRWVDGILDHAVDSMYLDWNPYYSDGSYADGYPSGISVSLKARATVDGRNEHRNYGSGTSDSGDRDEAIRDLIKRVKPKLPHIHGNKIRGMATIPIRKQRSIFRPIE